MRFPLSALVFAASQAYSQVPTASPSGPTQAASPVAFHRFQSKTAWGRLDALVRDSPGRFTIEVKSDSPASGWVLKEEGTGRTLSKGGFPPRNQFHFSVDRPYGASYRLTVLLNADRQEVPAILHLSAKSENSLKGAVPDTVEDFEPNPHHPYNHMVKSLYNEAVQSFGAGHPKESLEFLKKAAELDPRQPQVQSLLKQVRAKLRVEKEPHLLEQAKGDLKEGNKEAALAKISDYLEEHPEDAAALKLQDEIEGAKPASTKARKSRPIHPTLPRGTPTLPPFNPEERGAKADQAYNLGLESYRRKDYAAAKSFWEETLRISPGHPQAQRNLERLKESHPDLP